MSGCPLCADGSWELVHGHHVACSGCGLVYSNRPDAAFDTAEPPDGWRTRAAQIAIELPKSAVRCPSVEHLAALLATGPVYVETPNTRDPQLSLHHFFRNHLPAYYEPHTLAVAAIMAGADDMAIDEVGGVICAVLIPGAARKTYAEALSAFGAPAPQNVAHRMAHAFDRKAEVLGDVVEGACFLCGGERRAWRAHAICSSCSTLTALSQPPMLDELAVSFSSAPPFTERGFLGPSMRSTSPDDCDAVVQSRGVMLDDPGWAAALLRAGADMVHVSKRLGALHVTGVANGEPRRKSIVEAREVMKQPFRESRHTVAIWSMGKPTASRFETWMAGGDEADHAYLRAEAIRMHETASSAIAALEAIVAMTEAAQSDADDWHEDAELRGQRLGRAAMAMQVHGVAAAASTALMERATR